MAGNHVAQIFDELEGVELVTEALLRAGYDSMTARFWIQEKSSSRREVAMLEVN
jgi:hypothetical protein